MSLTVSIDQMVLEGLGYSQRENRRLANVFQAELEAYLGENDPTTVEFERWAEMTLAEGNLPLDSGMDVDETARRLAWVVMHKIRQQGGDQLSVAIQSGSPGKPIPPRVRSQLEAHLEALGVGSAAVGLGSEVDPSGALEQQAQQAGEEFTGSVNATDRSVDLGAVRIHDDQAAAMSAQVLKARAYTRGRRIYFNRGQYDPGSLRGQRLLAHELAHVVQQVGRRPTAQDMASRETIQRQEQGRQSRARRILSRRAVSLCQPANLQDRVVNDWLLPYFRREQAGDAFGIQPPYIYRLDMFGEGWIVPDLHGVLVYGNFGRDGHIDIEVAYRYAGETTEYIINVPVDLEKRNGDVIVVAVWRREVEGQDIEIYRQQARIVSSDEGCRLEPVPFPRPRRLEPDTLTPQEERLRQRRRRRGRGQLA